MKLQEADKILANLFPGKYRSVQYQLTTERHKGARSECAVYVADKGWCLGRTFLEAIDGLCGKNPVREEPQDIDDGGNSRVAEPFRGILNDFAGGK